MAKTAKKPKRIGRPSLRENNERFKHTGASDVILIGYQTENDTFSLISALFWLKDNRNQPEWLERFGKLNDFDSYNMGTHPERGDALDAINEKTRLVIGFHLNGLQHPNATSEGNDAMREIIRKMDEEDGNPKGYRYNRENITLPERCLAVGASLVVWGEQPFYLPEGLDATEMFDGSTSPRGCLYEPIPNFKPSTERTETTPSLSTADKPESATVTLTDGMHRTKSLV